MREPAGSPLVLDLPKNEQPAVALWYLCLVMLMVCTRDYTGLLLPWRCHSSLEAHAQQHVIGGRIGVLLHECMLRKP